MGDKKIKVMFVLQDLAGNGAVRAALNLVRHLDRRRFQIVLFVLRRVGPCISEVPADVPLVAASRRHRYKKFLVPYYLARLLRQARKCDIIVGASNLRVTYFAYTVGYITRKPVIGWVQVIIDKWLENCRRWHSRAVGFVYPKFTRVVCISDGIVPGLLRVAPVKSENIRVIYDGYEIDTFVSKSTEAIPSWFTDVLNKPTLMALGRFSEEKGFDILLKAHARVLQQGVDHNLVIVGSGPLRGDLEALARRLDVTESVFMPGYVHNPYPLLKNATALILSSRHEGFSGAVVEALALGTPVVATACGGPVESLSHGKYGILVEPGDVDSLAAGMTRILSDEALRGKYSAAGPERAESYRPEERVGDWEKLLCEVLDL